MNGGLLINMNKVNNKILVFILGIILFSGFVSADFIATIGMQGLNFINPQVAQIVNGILCVTSPGGIIACAEQYVEGKIIGRVTGEVFNEIAKVSPEAAQAILTYNQVKGYIDQGASILDELIVNEQGEIEKGIFDFNEKEYSLKNFLINSTAEDIIVSNANYDFLKNEITIKENGFLKLKVKNGSTEKDFVYKDIKDGGEFKLNNKGEIEAARFFSSKKGAEFEFPGLDKIIVEENAEILYINGTVTVKGNEFLYGNNLIKILSNVSRFAEIEGNSISCVECEIEGIHLRKIGANLANVDILNEGFLVNSGEVNYKQNKFSVIGADKVLVANPGADMPNYQGNWIRQTPNILEIHGSQQGDGIGVEFLEGHEILNTDNKDRFSVGVNLGDGLIFEKRENIGLIPKVTHISSENGMTFIKNDNIDFKVNKNGISGVKTKPLTEGDFSGKYQSVAFEIDSDSFKTGEKLRINSYSQFAILDRNNDEIVKYNTYGLPVSTLIKDNSLQTIEQLREKYPNIQFDIPYNNPDGEDNSLATRGVTPYHIYVIDTFLKNNPDAINDFDTIEFTDVFNAHVSSSTLQVGEKVIDVYGNVEIREIKNNPLVIIQDHEYIHRKVGIIAKQEIELIKSDSYIKEKLEEKAKLLAEIAISPTIEVNKKIADLDYEIKKYWYEKNQDKALLNQKYNELGLQLKRDIFDDRQKFGEFIDKFKEEKSSQYFRTFLLDYENYIQKKYDKDLNSYLKDIGYFSYSKENLNPEVFYTLLSREIYEVGIDEKDKDFSTLNKVYITLFNLNVLKISLDKNDEEHLFDSLYQTDELYRTGSNTLTNYLRSYIGVPYIYSIRNYDIYFDDVYGAEYGELPPTYKEQSLEVRKFFANSNNEKVRDTTRKLTQLAFDSGQIKVDEYKAIMGESNCKTSDCLDKLCVEYKLLCCVKYPTSPNCKS